MYDPGLSPRSTGDVVLQGAWCGFRPRQRTRVSIVIAAGRVVEILDHPGSSSSAREGLPHIDLSGFLVMPGLINAHDHLQFALFPRLANPPYRNYVDWGTDIHDKRRDVIARHRAVPKAVRLWWGGIKNLLCGVTTVCHHDLLWSELRRNDFPVRVVQNYGWAHSLALGGDLLAARSATPEQGPFILHACEGIDEQAHAELAKLDQLGLLDARTVLVHGLAIDDAGVKLIRQRRASLIVCPSSNQSLFERLPDMARLGTIENVALGNDSPLTAEGDLLDEVRFAGRSCGIDPDAIYRMVTEAPAAVLRLGNQEGSITAAGVGDLMAVRDTAEVGVDRLPKLSMQDVELVMVGGRVHLASEAIMERLPAAALQGLEPLWIDGAVRWLRAPVRDLLTKAEEVLGKGDVRLGGRPVRLPT